MFDFLTVKDLKSYKNKFLKKARVNLQNMFRARESHIEKDDEKLVELENDLTRLEEKIFNIYLKKLYDHLVKLETHEYKNFSEFQADVQLAKRLIILYKTKIALALKDWEELIVQRYTSLANKKITQKRLDLEKEEGYAKEIVERSMKAQDRKRIAFESKFLPLIHDIRMQFLMEFDKRMNAFYHYDFEFLLATRNGFVQFLLKRYHLKSMADDVNYPLQYLARQLDMSFKELIRELENKNHAYIEHKIEELHEDREKDLLKMVDQLIFPNDPRIILAKLEKNFPRSVKNVFLNSDERHMLFKFG